jgi:hypothetical protein
MFALLTILKIVTVVFTSSTSVLFFLIFSILFSLILLLLPSKETQGMFIELPPAADKVILAEAVLAGKGITACIA